MNVGEDKGKIVCDAIRERKPKVMVELGAYVGYASPLLKCFISHYHVFMLHLQNLTAWLHDRIKEESAPKASTCPTALSTVSQPRINADTIQLLNHSLRSHLPLLWRQHLPLPRAFPKVRLQRHTPRRLRRSPRHSPNHRWSLARIHQKAVPL